MDAMPYSRYSRDNRFQFFMSLQVRRKHCSILRRYNLLSRRNQDTESPSGVVTIAEFTPRKAGQMENLAGMETWETCRFFQSHESVALSVLPAYPS